MTRPTVLHVGIAGDGDVGTCLHMLSTMEGYEHARFDFPAQGRLSAAPLTLLRNRRIVGPLHRADIVHVHGAPALVYAWKPLALAERPTIWMTHGLRGWQKILARERLARDIKPALREILCTSTVEADTLRKDVPVLADRLRVVPVGLPRIKRDPQMRASMRRRLSLGDEKLVILTFAGLGGREQMQQAFAAVERARTGGVDASLVLAGNPRATAFARRADAHVQTVSLGENPYELIAAADIFLVPSTNQGHTFTIRAVMDYGVAIIAGDGPGHRETLGSAAWIVPLESVAIGDAIMDLAAKPARRDQLAGAARKRARSHFPASRMRAELRSAYERALQAGGMHAGK